VFADVIIYHPLIQSFFPCEKIQPIFSSVSLTSSFNLTLYSAHVYVKVLTLTVQLQDTS
jgi:hypothetical protein